MNLTKVRPTFDRAQGGRLDPAKSVVVTAQSYKCLPYMVDKIIERESICKQNHLVRTVRNGSFITESYNRS
jgi:hypothetical protein